MSRSTSKAMPPVATCESITFTPSIWLCATVALAHVPLSLPLKWTEYTRSYRSRSVLYCSRNAPAEGWEVRGSSGADWSFL